MTEATNSRASTAQEPSVPEATERVLAAFRDVVESRLDLVLLEARTAASRAAQSVALGVAAGLLALASWLAALGVVGVLLARTMDPAAALAVVAAVNAAVAALLAWIVSRRARVAEEAR
jgi:uncharacterized membrane protein YqjE